MAGRQRKLEAKAVDADPQAALQPGAGDRGLLRQRGTCFHAVKSRLKLRAAPPPRLAGHLALIDVLTDARGVRRVVEKARRTALGIADERLVARAHADLVA